MIIGTYLNIICNMFLFNTAGIKVIKFLAKIFFFVIGNYFQIVYGYFILLRFWVLVNLFFLF